MKIILCILLFSLHIYAPVYAQTTVGAIIDGTETMGQDDETNYAVNPGFEKPGLVGVVSGGTGAASLFQRTTYAPDVLKGKGSLQFGSSTVGHTFTIKFNAFDKDLYGKQCRVQLSYRGGGTGVAGYKVYTKQGAVTLSNSTQTVTIEDTAKSKDYFYSFPCGDATSGLVTVVFETTLSSVVNMTVDQVKGGLNKNVGTVQQAVFFGGMEQAGATGCNYSEGTSSGLTDFIDLGSGSGCNAWVVDSGSTGVITATGTNSLSLNVGALPAGRFQFVLTGGLYNSSANQTCVFRLSDGTNTYQPQQLYTGAASGAAAITNSLNYSVNNTTPRSSVTYKIQAADDSSGSCAFNNPVSSFVASWKIYYFPSSAQTAVSMSNYFWRVDANIAGGNPSMGLSAQSAYVPLEDANLTLTNNAGENVIPAQIPCSSTNAPTGTTCASGNESVGVSFIVPKDQDVLACASFTHSINLQAGAAVNATFQVIETPNNAQTISQEGKTRISSAYYASAATGNQVVSHPLRVCGNLSLKTGQRTLRLMYEQFVITTVNGNVVVADADGNYGQHDIHWEVYPISNTFMNPLIVGGLTTDSMGAGSGRHTSGSFGGSTLNNSNCAASSTCTIWSGTSASSVTSNGSPTYGIYLTKPYAAVPDCTCSCTSYGIAARGCNQDKSDTSGGTNIHLQCHAYDTVGTIYPGGITWSCDGPQ